MIRSTCPGAPAQSRRIDLIALALACTLGLLLVAMIGRVAQLQFVPSTQLRAHMDDRMTTVPEPAVRGDLLDRRWRLVAGTRFGYRAFVDPVRFPNPPGEGLARLADALDMPEDRVAERIVPRMAVNQQRALAALAHQPGDPPAPTLTRYVSIGPVLDDSRVQTVRGARIPGVYLELRSVREDPADSLVAPVVGAVGVDHNGLVGAEKLVNHQIKPTPGRLRYVRDASGRPMWVDPGDYRPPQRGRDIRLSLDLELQRIGTEELRRGVEDADAAGGRLVIMDPATGEILTIVDIIRDLTDAAPFPWDARNMADVPHRRYKTIADDPIRDQHPALGRNRCIVDAYEPGSTFKPFMWSVTTELGLAYPEEIINTENGEYTLPYGHRTIKDVTARDHMTWAEVLINSSNIGMAKTTRRMSDQQMRGAVLRFGFGSRTGLGLPGESTGIVTSAKSWSVYTQTSVAMGHEVAVTPVQMVRAFSAFARTGELAGTLPPSRLTAVDPDEASASLPVRVLPTDIAELTRQTMRGVTHNLDVRLARKDPDASHWRYEMFGKSGTAEIPLGPAPKGKRRPRGSKGYYPGQYNSSFIAGAPAEEPRLVVLVVIDDPGPERVAHRTHYGSAVAGPVVRRVMERSLSYLGVPPSPAAALAQMVAGRD